MSYRLRDDVQWAEIYGRHLTNWEAVAMLGAMAWRQAAEAAQRDRALASNLQSNQWSISGICYHLDSIGIRPDLMTMQWAMAQEGAAPPIRPFAWR